MPTTSGRLRFPMIVLSMTLYAALLFCLCPENAGAQIGGIDLNPGDLGTGGKNIIQGNIYYPSGRRLDRPVKVMLQTVGSGEKFTMTDDTGAFSFRRLKGGNYFIQIDPGSEYEPVSETVYIIDPVRRRGDSTGQTYTLQINLQPKQETRGVGGTVNVALAAAPKSALELYKSALESAQAGEKQKAIDRLKQALSLYPNFVLALNELGVQYLRLNQLDKASETLLSAIRIAPDAFAPRLNYGIVLVQKKDHPAAIEQLQQALQKDDTSATAHLYLGRALVNLAKYDEAERELQRAISLKEADVIEAHRYLGAIYIEKGNTSLAIDELKKYVVLAPKANDADQIRQIIDQLGKQAKRN